jgi:hypothetical protein
MLYTKTAEESGVDGLMDISTTRRARDIWPMIWPGLWPQESGMGSIKNADRLKAAYMSALACMAQHISRRQVTVVDFDGKDNLQQVVDELIYILEVKLCFKRLEKHVSMSVL